MWLHLDRVLNRRSKRSSSTCMIDTPRYPLFWSGIPCWNHSFSSALFVLLRQKQKSRTKRLSFEAMSLRYLGSNPFLDRHGQRMRRVERHAVRVMVAISFYISYTRASL